MAALSHGDRKAMAELKYPASFNQKVDVGKVKTDVIAKHIEDTLSSLLPPDDDITVQAFINEINAAEGTSLDPRLLQLFLTEYIGKQEAATYMENLWKLLLSAQSSTTGIAHEIIEAKVADLRSIESARTGPRVADGDRRRQSREPNRDYRGSQNHRRFRDERDERRGKKSTRARSISPGARDKHHRTNEKGSTYRDEGRRRDAPTRSRTPVDCESREKSPARHRPRPKSPRGRSPARDERPANSRRRSSSSGDRTPIKREDRHRENGRRYRDDSRSRSRSSRRHRQHSRSRRNVARDFRDERRNRRTWDSYRPSERTDRKRRNSSSDEDESKPKRNRDKSDDVDEMKTKRSRDISRDLEETKNKRTKSETEDKGKFSNVKKVQPAPSEASDSIETSNSVNKVSKDDDKVSADEKVQQEKAKSEEGEE